MLDLTHGFDPRLASWLRRRHRRRLVDELVRLQCAQAVEVTLDPYREELSCEVRWTPEADQRRRQLEALLALPAMAA